MKIKSKTKCVFEVCFKNTDFHYDFNLSLLSVVVQENLENALYMTNKIHIQNTDLLILILIY